MVIEAIPFDAQAEGPLFDGTLAVWQRLIAERDPAMDPDSAEEMRCKLRGSETFAKEALVATVDGRPAGLARVWIHHIEGNLDKAEACIEVDPEQRRRGVATALLGAVLDVCDRNGRTRLAGVGLHGGANDGFWTSFGAELGMVERESRLWVADTDPAMMRAWVDGRHERAAGYGLIHWRGTTPAPMVPAMAVLMNAMNDAPRDDLTWADDIWTEQDIRAWDSYHELVGVETWTSVVLAPDGSPAGLTTVVLNPRQPRFASQGDTVVLAAHRNRGLGRWLKGDMWLRLRADAPQVEAIDTDNAQSNEPMLAINVAMGFRPLAIWGIWQADVARLRAGLAARSAPARS